MGISRDQLELGGQWYRHGARGGRSAPLSSRVGVYGVQSGTGTGNGAGPGGPPERREGWPTGQAHQAFASQVSGATPT